MRGASFFIGKGVLAMRHSAVNLLRNDQGQGMVEYGLIVALVAVLLIGAVIALKGGLNNVFDRVTGCMNAAAQGSGC